LELTFKPSKLVKTEGDLKKAIEKLGAPDIQILTNEKRKNQAP